MTFEELQDRAERVFYSFWIEEGTPEECKYYMEYFQKYPNKGNYTTFYNRCLVKHVKILFSSWDYETPTVIYTPRELLQEIETAENDYI